MFDNLVTLVNKYLVLATNLLMPIGIVLILFTIMKLESNLTSFSGTFTQMMQAIQTVDNQSLSQINTIGQLIQIMNAAAAGKFMNPSNTAS